VLDAFVIPASEPVSRNSGAIHRTLQIRHDPTLLSYRPPHFVIPASEPVSSFSGCRIKSGMTIELPKQKRGGANQKKQKRGGASRPKDNFIIPPFDSAASAAERPRLDGCTPRLLL